MDFSREFYSEDYPFDQFKDHDKAARKERHKKRLEEELTRLKNDPEYAAAFDRRFNLTELFSRMDKETWDYACRRYGCPND
jgi:hypothetical protein